ncbi:putative nucleotidyltransferase [Agrobacterium larrymoorei]|uniref:Nucleotidyltransferase n=1 Tax=Agrobacterium larrymoorei TaxID=160699 RepID=A0ABU0UPD0_9HYPH|nr:putative nucleotidyltransferase [Agrobacterium larrymoorei]
MRRTRVFSVRLLEEKTDRIAIDILVDALPGTTLFDLGGLLEELSEIMKGTDIHLLTAGDLPERIRFQVVDEARPI